jgi:hypothetical protein
MRAGIATFWHLFVKTLGSFMLRNTLLIFCIPFQPAGCLTVRSVLRYWNWRGADACLRSSAGLFARGGRSARVPTTCYAGITFTWSLRAG